MRVLLQVTQTSVVCGPGEVTSVAETFGQKWDIRLRRVEDVEDSFLSE